MRQDMAKCSRCGADTILRVNGVPLCVECDKALSASKRGPQSDSERKPNEPGRKDEKSRLSGS